MNVLEVNFKSKKLLEVGGSIKIDENKIERDYLHPDQIFSLSGLDIPSTPEAVDYLIQNYLQIKDWKIAEIGEKMVLVTTQVEGGEISFWVNKDLLY